MRKFMITLLIIMVSIITMFPTTAHATHSGTHACVTKREYNHLDQHMGDTREEIALFLDTDGTYAYSYGAHHVREYPWCNTTTNKVALVGYKHGKARVYGWMSDNGGVF